MSNRVADRLTWALLAGAGAALVLASGYRAATFPFTHDESLSFAIFNWQPRWRFTANHHPLNTLLMQACHAALGASPLALRVPNLLALMLYLGCALALLRRLEHPLLRAAGFALLALNPYVLDFFFLARGYGLALGFQMASLLCFVIVNEDLRPGWLALSVVAGGLAVYANYAFLNAFVPLVTASAWLLFRRRRTAIAIALIAVSGVFVAFVASELRELQRDGGLHFGGEAGFFADTVVSLVRCSLYSVHYAGLSPTLLAYLLVAVLVVALMIGLRARLPALLLFLLAGAVLLSIVQHRWLGARYPIERAALYTIPLYAAALLFALRATRSRIAAMTISAALVVILGVHFSRSFDPGRCYTWQYDAHNDRVLEIIDQDRRRSSPAPVRLSVSWMLEPSMNFYRVTREYDWLEPVVRARRIDGRADYVYAFARDAARLPAGSAVVLAWYPDTQTVLLRMNPLLNSAASASRAVPSRASSGEGECGGIRAAALRRLAVSC